MLDATFTVSDLVDTVREALGVCFPDEIWVEGEIADLQTVDVRRGQPSAGRHVYFSLVDPPDADADAPRRPQAVVPVTLFDSQRRGVNARLRREGSVKMADGVRIRVRGRLDLYGARSQIQLRMTAIDPSFTVGLLATARDRVLQALAADGLLDRNRALPMPLLPIRVGLVTADRSAAMADFVHELETSGFGWQVRVVAVRVQGAGADRGIGAALRQLDRAGVDVIALVRGGGARTELATFDSEHIARTIAALATPVLTGIGHEIDDSVADRVAHGSHKTPTACAAALVDRARAATARAETAWAGVQEAAERSISAPRQHLDRAAGRLASGARVHLQTHGHRLTSAGQRLAVSPGRSLAAAERRLEARAAQVRAHDPVNVLRRGFSITRTDDGRLVRATEVEAGTVLITSVHDGEVESVARARSTPPPPRSIGGRT